MGCRPRDQQHEDADDERSRDGGGIDVSPDGRWIAYHASDSGRPEVYVQAYPGSGPRYQLSSDGRISPIWRRDGRELFYLRPSSLGDSTNSAVLSVGNIRVMAVPVTPKPALALSAPRLLFEGPYDVNVPAAAMTSRPMASASFCW
jgi:Tol biopolymer transport system component